MPPRPARRSSTRTSRASWGKKGMKNLYIAYSCNPYAGSEDKIGWNIPYAASKCHEVWVITKEEQREPVERFLRENPTENLRFSFVDIPGYCKKLFKGFLYSGRLNAWHKRAYPVAKQICAENGIDVIHQITPIEFRAIGPYKKIKNVKFICGPLGGGEYIPKGLRSYAKGHMAIERIRAAMNVVAKWKLALNSRLKKCDAVMYANYETKNYLKRVAGKNADGKVVTEIGVSPEDLIKRSERQKKDKIVFLSAGRLVYRKGYDFLLDALEQFPDNARYELRIVGGGQDYEHLNQRIAASQKLKRHVVLTGKIPFTEMQKEYLAADAFVMPSIRETTGSVILEAFSYGLPVITSNHFGGAFIVNEQTGWLYNGKTKQEFIDGLAQLLLECISDPEEVMRRGKNAGTAAEQYLWTHKVDGYNSL